MTLPPLHPYPSGTANTHAPLLATPHLAGRPHPYYVALRLFLALRLTTLTLTLGTRTHAILYEGITHTLPLPRIYPGCILPTAEKRPHTPYLRIPIRGCMHYGYWEDQNNASTPYAYISTLPCPHDLRFRLSGNRGGRRGGRTPHQHHSSPDGREREGEEDGWPRQV
jgi:hypothetical protein